MTKPTIEFLLSDTAVLPTYATELSSGFDLHADIVEPLTIQHGNRALISTGLKVALPPNTELQIRPRSGLALKHGISIVNTPGTIDEDYRGDIGVILINTSSRSFTIYSGDRIAQAVLVPVIRANIERVYRLTDTVRGDGGFGHTGTK